MKHAPLDNAVEIVTPENIAFRYRVAGPFRRLPAYVIDLGIRIGACLLGSIVAGLALAFLQMPGLGGATFFVLWFAFAWLYGGVFEALWNGQTPGKRLLGLRVLTIEGQPISGWQAVLRNVLRAVDLLPIYTYQVGLLAMMMNRRFQRLGDLAAGTMVVVEEPQWFQGVLQFREPEVDRMASQIPPHFQASRTMAQALATYVRRRPHFPWPRRLEIARHLGEPLRQQFRLPPETNLDLLLCALYQRTFVTDRHEASEVSYGASPFAPGSLASELPTPEQVS